MTTTTVFSTTADGYAECASAVYATARSGAGTLAVSTSAEQGLLGQQLFSGTYKCWEMFFAFDLSGIPATDVVSAAVFSLWGSDDQSTTDFTILALAKTWLATLTTADFVAGASLGGLTELATYATSGGFAAGAERIFTQTGAALVAAAQAAVTAGGSLEIMCASSLMRDNTAPTGQEYVVPFTSDRTGTGEDPKLVITHAPLVGPIPMAYALPARKHEMVGY